MTNIKFALYKYSTNNIGDEIQSIAARRFLPQVDYYIDRDAVGDWINQNKDETVKLIANGWYMHEPAVWPPADSTLKILPISMHVSAIEPAPSVFSSKESISYLKKFDEIGARDTSTKEFFESKGVKSYFSGCLTLTLQKDPDIKRQDYVLAVDVSSRVVEFMRSKTHRPVIELTTMVEWQGEGPEERMAHAERYLYLYQSAHAVVTTRLHTMLPSLAFDTPVLFLMDHGSGLYDPTRYSGLDGLVRKSTTDNYLNNYRIFNLDDPGKNQDRYIKYRKNLIKTTSAFTGYDNKETWRRLDISKITPALVSIIIPVHNTKKSYLIDCFESIRKQSYCHLEVIIVDDGSNKETADIIDKYVLSLKKNGDTRWHVLRQNNKGLSNARNVGYSKARGKYIQFLDSDDSFKVSLIQKIVERAEATNADIVVENFIAKDYASGEERVILHQGQFPPKNTFKLQELVESKIGAIPYSVWSKLFKKEFLDKHKIQHDEELTRAEDILFTYSALLKAKRISVVYDPYIIYRENLPNSNSRTNDRFPSVSVKAWEKLYNFMVKSDNLENYKKDFEAAMLSSLHWHYERLNTWTGKVELAKAAKKLFRKVNLTITHDFRVIVHLILSEDPEAAALIEEKNNQLESLRGIIESMHNNLQSFEARLTHLERPGVKLATRKLAGALKRKLQYLVSTAKERIVKK